jgi:hypothetical protein
VVASPAALPPLWPAWRLHCRQAAGLLLQDQDQPLRWPTRLRLRLHLAACQACTRFAGQLSLMQGALGGWRRYRDAGDAVDEGDDR